MSAIGQRVRDARVAKGWSQRDLESMAKLCSGHVSLIERGERSRLTADTLSSLANALSVSLTWLINGTDDNVTRNRRASMGRGGSVHNARKSAGAR